MFTLSTIHSRLTRISTARYIQRSGIFCDDGGHVKRRISGVSIGGVKWKLGKHCLYQDGAGGVNKFGSVTNMYRGVNTMMDEFIIFELNHKPITAYMGHYCLLSDNNRTSKFVMWHQVLWKCKALMLGDHTSMALPFQSCNSREQIQFN